MSVSISIKVIFLFFISKYGMTESSNRTNCVMSNSGYSSDSVVDKSEDEVSVVVIYFKSIFYKFVHNFVCHFVNFFISEYGMAESSNSTNCVMSNSSYSSDSMVNKSEEKISVFFVVFHICQFKKCICHFFSQFVAFFISEYGMTKSSNSTDCVMSNSSYSSDSVVNKSEEKVFVFFCVSVFD